MSAGSDGTIEYGGFSDSEYNPLKLYNPLCQDFSDSVTAQRNVVRAIYNEFSHINIKPFSGSFLNNPLIEFMDNLIIIDINGIAYNSFVGEHTMNYLGSSDIANYTPTVSQNKRTVR